MNVNGSHMSILSLSALIVGCHACVATNVIRYMTHRQHYNNTTLYSVSFFLFIALSLISYNTYATTSRFIGNSIDPLLCICCQSIDMSCG